MPAPGATLLFLEQVPKHRLQERAALHCLGDPHPPSELLAQCPTVGLWRACYKDKDAATKGSLHPEP